METPRRAFSIVVMAALFLSGFTPFAYAAATPADQTAGDAQTPSTTQSTQSTATDALADCPDTLIHEISESERKQLWDSTLGFQAKEINDLAPADALTNTAGDVTSPMNLNVAPQGAEQTVDFRSFAVLMGKTSEADLKTLAKQTGVRLDKDGNVPSDARALVSRANLYAESAGKKSVLMQKLAEWGLVPGGATTLPAAAPNPYDNLKISLPGNGKQIALSDLYKLQDLNPNSCLLGDTIKGRVSYAGLLNKDITYGQPSKQLLSGSYESPATDGKDTALSVDSNQHFRFGTLLAYLDRGGGGSILVPAYYEEWLKWFRGINDIQMLTALIGGIGSVALEKQLAQRTIITKEAFERANAQTAIIAQEYSSLARSTDPAVSGALSKKVGPLIDKYTANPNSLTSAQQLVAERSIAKDELAHLNLQIKQFKTMQATASRFKQTATGMLYSSLIFGIGWLGPGRIVYEVSDGFMMQASGSGNKYVKIAVNRELAKDYRDATDPGGLGRVQELVGKLTDGATGTPEKVFNPGKVFIINKGEPQTQAKLSNSITTVRPASEGGWNIATQWAGQSSSVNFEDLRKINKDEKFTSMNFVVNEILPEGVIDRSVNGDMYKYVTAIALPVMLSKSVFTEAGRAFGIAMIYKGFAIGMAVDEDQGKDLPCTKNDLNGLKSTYLSIATIGYGSQIILTVVLPATSLATGKGELAVTLRTIGKIGTSPIMRSTSDILNWVNPVEALQMYHGNVAMTYVTNCMDSQYKILAYAPLSTEAAGAAAGNAGTNPLQALQSLTSQLSAGSAAENTYAPKNTSTQLDKLKDALSFRAVMDGQNGAVAPEEIYYLQIEESAWSVQGGLFDQLERKGCKFSENYQSGDALFNLGEDGITVYNKDGSVRLALTDYWNKVRALARMRSQENGRVILPNRIIEHSFDCSGAFMEINYQGDPSLTGDCNADCLKKAIAEVTGRDVGNDLTPFIGRISSVDTDKGIATFADDAIGFTVLYPDESSTALDDYNSANGNAGEKEKFGQEVTAPGYDKLGGLASRQELRASKLKVYGDGKAELTGSGVPATQIGKIKTIIGDRGKMEFSNGKVLVFIYSLAESSSQNIKAVTASLKDGEINAKVVAKTGAEESGSELNAALDKIQGSGGLNSLETEDKIYYFDGDKLRVIDKNTGEATDYVITGSKDLGNGQFRFDTDKGPIQLGVGMQNGQPTLTTTDSSGLKEILALLAARGDNGILTFNPSTGAINVYNGQDIPLSSDFTSKGIGFMADQNGNTRGVPVDNPFTKEYKTGGTAASNGLNLPAWPEDNALMALMLAAALLGIAFVRRFDE
ncbi:hypothetical protein COX86_00140 [Candidatus Micrarchaeota archaeon CG_4_10_14_0_2_um_filter_60_11]|nr:MAG: hypothetical protein COX86_00140 [Candidatus Micrarchaeota archaeon CG_4_10_14_0_2_um_filter_60_11]